MSKPPQCADLASLELVQVHLDDILMGTEVMKNQAGHNLIIPRSRRAKTVIQFVGVTLACDFQVTTEKSMPSQGLKSIDNI